MNLEKHGQDKRRGHARAPRVLKPPTSYTTRKANEVWSWDISYLPSQVKGRPRVSNDNPYSESLFRTLKYCPQWPSKGFASLEDARIWVNEFVLWYNHEHRHSRIRYVTPAQRHQGIDKDILKSRTKVYQKAKENNPIRWSGKARNWSHIDRVELNQENQSKVSA